MLHACVGMSVARSKAWPRISVNNLVDFSSHGHGAQRRSLGWPEKCLDHRGRRGVAIAVFRRVRLGGRVFGDAARCDDASAKADPTEYRRRGISAVVIQEFPFRVLRGLSLFPYFKIMDPFISRRILGVQSPMIPVVGEMIKRHPGTISLGQGVVHYGPPAALVEATAKAVGSDPRVHRYGLALGLDPLLDAIRSKLEAENGIAPSPDHCVAVTAGSNMGFLEAVLAIADPGDEVILLSPFYFNQEMAIVIAGCKAVIVATDAEYQPVIGAIEAAITDRTRAIVTVSPNNPTGAVYPADILAAINGLCKSRNIYHIADEAYEYFTYEPARHFSPASLPGSASHTISLYSLSKAYGMAGWRIGYMVLPSHLEESMKKIQDTNLICPPLLNQLAATAALGAGRAWCQTQIAPFGAVRNLVLGELSRLGDRVRLPSPGGAFYALMQVHSPRPDMELVEDLIHNFGVAVMPGSTFGTPQGCYLRVAYGALDQSTVAEGMGRLVRGLRELI